MHKFDIQNEGAISLHVQGEPWQGFPGERTLLGEPGVRMRLILDSTASHPGGHERILTYRDDGTGLEADNHILFFGDLPISRRWVTVRHTGAQPLVVDTLYAAFIDNLAWQTQEQYRLHIPANHSYAENQWRMHSLSDLGVVKTRRQRTTHYSVHAIGRSGQVCLPMAMLEDQLQRATWIWQIEHSGAWLWEVDEGCNTLCLGLGGLDERHNHWFKVLQPGSSITSLPVAVGRVAGDPDSALAALTAFRRVACRTTHPVDGGLPVIFNDYMNCLMGKVNEEKSLRLIPHAAAAGCEVYTMDAGWYGADGWGDVGDWHEAPHKFPHGLKSVMNAIRQAGMIPGLWIEIESVAKHVALAGKPDDWFITLRGRRHLHGNSRYALDFRNPAVRQFADDTLDRLIGDYGLGYIKFDYNISIGLGTDYKADSPGDGALAHTRAVQKWFAALRARHPRLIMENCASGGLRNDYAMLSILQLASISDQTDYRLCPALVAGGLAAILPEQLGIWSYPKVGEDREAAIFNMVNVLLARIEQSGPIADISDEQRAVIHEGITLYKTAIRADIRQAIPVWPLGRTPIEQTDSFQTVGLRVEQQRRTWLAVWRLNSAQPTVQIPLAGLGAGRMQVEQAFPRTPLRPFAIHNKCLEVTLAQPYMAVLFCIT